MVVEGRGARFLLSQRVIYHERQGANRLCGQHVVNMLLQEPKCTGKDLRSAASELDSGESMILGMNPTSQYKSGNADSDGFFNVSVIEKVLMRFGIGITVFTNKLGDVSEDPTKTAEALLINFGAHWYCYRRIKEVWFELNSMQPTPLILTEQELKGCISQLKVNQGSIFYVYRIDGSQMPIPDDWITDLAQAKKKVATPDTLLLLDTECIKFKDKDSSKAPNGTGKGDIVGKAAKEKTNVFSGAGQSLGSAGPESTTKKEVLESHIDISNMTEDEQIAHAIKMSMAQTEKPSQHVKTIDVDLKEEPSEDLPKERVCKIMVRKRSGDKADRFIRKFDREDFSIQVVLWINSLLSNKAGGKMTTSVPPVFTLEVLDNTVTLNGDDVSGRQIKDVFLRQESAREESYNLIPF